MTPQRWRQLQDVLAPVLELEPAAQRAALEAACAGDAQLLAEALELLAHQQSLPAQLPAAALRPLAGPDDDDEDHWLGRRIGLFVLDKHLGSGGSSTVYRAHRADEFEQTVAIKLLRAGDRRLQRRFQRERSILAGLNHAHIARLFDAGSTPEGRPYLVLEYVDGRTWDRWLAEDKPDLATRISQFLRLCEAVEYAHQRLLVHRDIKPANILLSGTGRDRIAKIADFGLAKAFDQAGLSGLTMTGAVAGTMAFMPRPQMIDFKYAKPDVDVWAMAASLYWMLTGRLPRSFPQGVDPIGVVLGTVAVPIRDRNPAIPDRLADVIDRALIDRPNIVVTSARELASELRDAL